MNPRVQRSIIAQGYNGLRRLLGFCLVVGPCLAYLGCDGPQRKAPVREISLDLPQLSPNASRADLVARADKLAVTAPKKEAKQAAAGLEEAARFREQAFRAFGKEVDALEAIELYSDAASFDAEQSCDFGLRIAAIKAQLSKDPDAQFRELYLLKQRLPQSPCSVRVGRALGALRAFRPDEESLSRLRKTAQAERHTEPRTEHRHPGEQALVVAPEVLRRSLDEPTKITKIEPYFAERTARIIVGVTHPTKFDVGSLPGGDDNGPRLFVDIEHATFDGPGPVEEAKGLVRRIRLGSRPGASRIVLDLAQAVYHRVFYLPEPFRLVIDLSLDSPEERANPRQIRRVVLDPGHGGHDPGAVGPNGLREKDVALDIAHRAAPLLAREVGVSTLLTRDVDAYVPLDERSARANAFHADLFISIHLNASPDRDSNGVMTFVLDTSQDETASKIAARENSSSEAAAAELANSLSRIESADRRAASDAFAHLLQRAAGASLRQKYGDIADHGVRSAGFYVLAGAAMPAVLFEGAFISNPMEARRLNHEDYRQRLADSIVNAVRAYREGL